MDACSWFSTMSEGCWLLIKSTDVFVSCASGAPVFLGGMTAEPVRADLKRCSPMEVVYQTPRVPPANGSPVWHFRILVLPLGNTEKNCISTCVKEKENNTAICDDKIYSHSTVLFKIYIEASITWIKLFSLNSFIAYSKWDREGQKINWWPLWVEFTGLRGGHERNTSHIAG